MRHLLSLLLLTLTSCGEDSIDGSGAPPQFVGGARCAECHEQEHATWTGSHHDLAMQVATPETVLGDFSDVEFEKDGVTTRFFRDGERFMVRTDGPDGALHDYEVAYAFGVDPLQQYLVAFPDGRYQALGVAWDARSREAGGQRWFHLYPDEEIPHDDVLHWTGRLQNWNFMCADCHSTDLRRGYDAERDAYATTWAELDVSCEACHGPGSRHVTWAEAGADGGDSGLVTDLTNRGAWAFAPDAPTAHRVLDEPVGDQVDTCGLCHSRRTAIRDGFAYGSSLLDSHRPALLEDPLYFADGQIRDEVYVWGSFRQSKMHAAGVVCSDCHEPHGLALRADGNALCIRCHAAPVFDVPSHHHHEPGTEGASCVACHMPLRTYMVVDPRHDHGFRVPRPDLSVAHGTPNTCNTCHDDRGARWAADAVAEWRGERRPERHWAPAFAADFASAAEAAGRLTAIARAGAQPGFVRASALALLGERPSPESVRAARGALADADPLVRLGAVRAFESVPVEVRSELLPPLCSDSVLAVRAEAARVLAPAAAVLRPDARAAFDRAFADYVETQRVNADQPWAHTNLGIVYLELGRAREAEAAYRHALRLDPRFVLAWVNLADLHRAEGRDAASERTLREGLAAVGEDATLEHALGLALVRLGRADEALPALARAFRLAPENARFGYVYAVALESTGARARAIEVLEQVLARHPGDRDVRHALESFR